MSKLTAWFPGHIKPAYVGVYQQKAEKYIGYQRWDGISWFYWHLSIDEAENSNFPAADCYQNDPWRGLANDPKGES